MQEFVTVHKPFPTSFVAKYMGKRATYFQALRWSPWRQCSEKKCECPFRVDYIRNDGS